MAKIDTKAMSLFEKILEVQKAVNYLQKENNGPQYQYVSGVQAVTAIRSKMDELGLILKSEILSQEVSERSYEKPDKYGVNGIKQMVDYFTKIKMKFTWINVDKPEERDENLWESQGVDIAGEKGIGKAATYGEKYFILKYFHIATDKEDPDSYQQSYGLDNSSYEVPSEPAIKRITLEQKEEFGRIMKAKGINQDKAREIMINATKKTAINDLTYSEAELLKTKFNAYVAKDIVQQ